MGPRWEHLECSLLQELKIAQTLSLQMLYWSESITMSKASMLVIEKGYMELKLSIGIHFLSWVVWRFEISLTGGKGLGVMYIKMTSECQLKCSPSYIPVILCPLFMSRSVKSRLCRVRIGTLGNCPVGCLRIPFLLISTSLVPVYDLSTWSLSHHQLMQWLTLGTLINSVLFYSVLARVLVP